VANELCTERAQLEMQLVEAQVVVVVVVASEATTRASLEAAKQSTEDCALLAQSDAFTAATEHDALATRLALVEAEIEKLRAATASANEAAERATTTAVTAEATARDTAQAAAEEKVTLGTKVADLEQDLATTGVDLTKADCQFSEVANQLQVASEEVTRLWESNAKLSEDLEGELTRRFPSPFSLFAFSPSTYSF
jgi:chromosome segregation ATPase